MGPERLAKRYRSLWMGETTSILIFTGLFLRGVLSDPDWSRWIVRGYSLTVVNLILLQGVAWWLLKARWLKQGKGEEAGRALAFFGGCRRLNWVLIGLAVLVLVAKQQVTGTLWMSRDTWFGLLILCGAVLEQINYYYYQLMYDNRYDRDYLRTKGRLRIGNIAFELRKRARTAPISAR